MTVVMIYVWLYDRGVEMGEGSSSFQSERSYYLHRVYRLGLTPACLFLHTLCALGTGLCKTKLAQIDVSSSSQLTIHAPY